MHKLSVIFASTRPGRRGLPVARWFAELAKRHAKFDVQFIDLQLQNLPLYDEPNHPRSKQYTQDHTRAWSSVIDASDAFVFVTPEYNYSTPPALVNALDFLFHEWGYKAAGFVSYGGVSGGCRAVQNTKLTLTTLRVMPIPEAVTIPFFEKSIQDNTFNGPPELDKSAEGMLNELERWTTALRPLRS
jgi:NAD(P)H-dependent FMN reductase